MISLAKPIVKTIGMITTLVASVLLGATFFLDSFYWYKMGTLSISTFLASFGDNPVYIPSLLLVFFPYLYIFLFGTRVVLELLQLLNRPAVFKTYMIFAKIFLIIALIVVSMVFLLFILSNFTIAKAFPQIVAFVFLGAGFLFINYVNHYQKAADTPYVQVLALHLQTYLFMVLLGIAFWFLLANYTPTILTGSESVSVQLAPQGGLYLFVIFGVIGMIGAGLEFLGFTLPYIAPSKKQS
jgi:hypothetical protein